MSLIADGILILTCLTTALYCYVLSRRLQKLSSTDEGIGQQIKQLNAALEETRGAQRDINSHAKAASDKLMREVASARKAAKDLGVRLEHAGTTLAALERANTVVARGYPAEVSETAAATSAVPERAAELDAEDVPEPAAEEFAPVEDEAFNDAADYAEEDGQLADEEPADSGNGEQQLGFLPDIDVQVADEEKFQEPPGPGGGDEKPGADTSSAEDPVASAVAAQAGAADAGLLKVERVAL